MSLALPLFLQLAASVAPSIAPETLAAFAQAESKLEPFAIGDNDTGQSYQPATAAAAVALATSLLSQRHSLDLGIMQVNSANLARVGLTVATAFDPGQSIRAGAVILADAYQRCRRNGTVEEQAALRCAASVYNTGREQAGIANGYQPRVWRVAAQLVPAIQIAAGAVVPPSPGIASDDVVAPQPRTPPRPMPAIVFEDALHPSPPAQDEEGVLSDALHLPEQKDPS
ncbi:MAG: lytic transglycosylase domain-containing protein [Janthinobacterium lividum]